MPAAGYSSYGGAYDTGAGMPSSSVFNGNSEFLLDGDDFFQNSDGFGLGDADAGVLQPFGHFGGPKSLLNSSEGPVQQSILGPSPPSHRGSSSSGSSRRSADSTSPKTSYTSGDAMMIDDGYAQWKPMDGLPNGDHTDYGISLEEGLDSSVNPHFEDLFDYESASSSPSPPAADGQTSLSPENTTNSACLPGHHSNVKQVRGHNKAQSQQSLAQSMSGLQYGSREQSPILPSHESSPAYNQSPSPHHSANYVNGSSSGAIWNHLESQGCTSRPQYMTSEQIKSEAGAGRSHVGPSFPPQQSLVGNQPRLVVERTTTKSRVETQIPIKLIMSNLPPHVKRLHLPHHTMSKAKLFAKHPEELKRSPEMLELYTMLVCTSAMQDPEKKKKAFARAAAASHPISSELSPDEEKPQNGGEVRICEGCISREKKRAGRKKNKKPEEEELWNRFQKHRAIVFNTNEIKEWQTVTETNSGVWQFRPERPLDVASANLVQVEAPMRIACYCRHHNEKLGFQVIFTIKDYQDNVIVQESSSSIMITDDHKTHLSTNPTASASTSAENISSASAVRASNEGKPSESSLVRQSQSTSNLQSLPRTTSQAFQPPVPNAFSSQTNSVAATPRNVSRQGSPTTPAGPVSKKRKASNSSKVPAGLAMTRLENTQPSTVFSLNAQNDSATLSASTSPFSPPLNNFPVTGASLFPQGQQQQGFSAMPQPFATGASTSNGSNEQLMFQGMGRPMNLENTPVNQPMYSAPVSAHQSRAPSPNHLLNDANPLQNPQLTQPLYGNGSMGMTSARAPQPMIHKIIPGEGPTTGGIEVTILGSGFTNGGLEVMFGDQKATTTTFWGETSLVCLLPPACNAGSVLVSINAPRMSDAIPVKQNMFRYVDDNEEQLMRTALAVLGHKMGGNMSDIAGIARGIIHGTNQNQGGWGPVSGSGPPSGGFSQFESAPDSLETGLLRVLELIDLDDSINKARINLRRSTGQTMLHLACALGLHRFAAGLLSRGASAGARDKGGFTPLHFAAMNDHSQIVRRLMISGADPTMRSLSGLTPADVAQSRDVLRALRRVENHSRSRSTGSLHSRVSSATSLKSLWDPPTVAAHGQDFLSDASDSQENQESFDGSSDDDDAENDEWLDIRRASLPRNYQLSEVASAPAPGVPAAMASPSAAVAAFGEQLTAQFQQQFQQAMASFSQNWSQFQMPVLPDYHHYLNNAPVMQRIASLVPNISGSRPGSSGDQQPRDGDKQWWERPSFFGAKEAPPPAYEDIFPQTDLDTKQATAATAAVEYEADAKCAALYDQSNSGSSKAQEVPTLLKIGRKNAITKEQQENFQRAHAERLKTGSSDKMLWFVWIPLLTFILGAMLHSLFSGAPAIFSGAVSFSKSVASFVAAPRQGLQPGYTQALGNP